MSTPPFLFATCQIGAENALKQEVARLQPDFRFAYSRPGFLTFKLPEDRKLMADFPLGAVFARTHGYSLGKVTGDDPEQLAREIWEIYGTRPVRRIHVWERDARAVGEHDFEPSVSEHAAEVHKKLVEACPTREDLPTEASDPYAPARRGDFVLDCVMVDPHEWWVGYHRAKGFASRHPGGMLQLDPPEDMASRAWLKFEEALRWSKFPIENGARCVDIGSAPGGSSQALLARGASVWGVDPAAMAPQVSAHPSFTHIRKRVADVKRRDLRKVRWLLADMNVAPAYTLEALESIVLHPEIQIRGMVFTLKLFEWGLAEHLPEYLDRVREWGFNETTARQLQHNRQEITVAAIKRPFHRNRPHKQAGPLPQDGCSSKKE